MSRTPGESDNGNLIHYPQPAYKDVRVLDAAMPNTLAWRMGEACRKAADRKDVGDCIDRGLILLRLLNEAGFTVTADYNKA